MNIEPKDFNILNLNILTNENTELETLKLNQTIFPVFGDINQIILNAKDSDIIMLQNNFDEFQLGIKFTYLNEKYFLKTFTSKDNRLTHEAFVGLTAINNISGFVKTYTIGYNNKIFYNNKIYEYDFIVIEYIEGLTFRQIFQYINELSIYDFQIILLQIFNSLLIANRLYKFTHYDLHKDNIIIKKLDEEIVVNILNRKFTTRYIPIIIDLELSHIIIDNINYGINIQNANVYNINYILSDIINLFISLYGTIEDNKYKSFNSLTKKYLNYFFNNFNDQLYQEINTRGLGYSIKYASFDLENFMKFIFSTISYKLF